MINKNYLQSKIIKLNISNYWQHNITLRFYTSPLNEDIFSFETSILLRSLLWSLVFLSLTFCSRELSSDSFISPQKFSSTSEDLLQLIYLPDRLFIKWTPLKPSDLSSSISLSCKIPRFPPHKMSPKYFLLSQHSGFRSGDYVFPCRHCCRFRTATAAVFSLLLRALVYARHTESVRGMNEHTQEWITHGRENSSYFSTDSSKQKPISFLRRELPMFGPKKLILFNVHYFTTCGLTPVQTCCETYKEGTYFLISVCCSQKANIIDRYLRIPKV